MLTELIKFLFRTSKFNPPLATKYYNLQVRNVSQTKFCSHFALIEEEKIYYKIEEEKINYKIEEEKINYKSPNKTKGLYTPL